jgi:L-threonylcarbamoyladenylate synthase
MSDKIVQVAGDDPDPAVVERALRLLRAGEIVIYPTDTLYALGGAALDADVARRVAAAKGRPRDKPLPLIAADEEQARSLCRAWSRQADALARRFWPGALTLVLPARDGLPSGIVSRDGALAVRVPDLDLARRLSRGAGPLVSTSANRAGETAPTSCAAAFRAVGDSVALALDAGPAQASVSTIVDATRDRPRVLRAGRISEAEIKTVLDREARLIE